MSPPSCACAQPRHTPRRVVVTGGPGAGKTAALEVVRRHFCRHVVVLPEAASILFGGGFPRGTSTAARHAAQRAIYRVQSELERMTLEDADAAIVLCDRGTIDSLAYWDGPEGSFWAELGTTHAAELARYDAVIHLRTPPADRGYNHVNPLRTESAMEAAQLDVRILAAWAGHPGRVVIDSHVAFIDKLVHTLDAIRALVPPCCRAQVAEISLET